MSQRSVLPDKELMRAAQRFLGKTVRFAGAQPTDGHALIQQFGVEGTPLVVGDKAILVITKPCIFVEWTMDVLPSGTAAISLEWSPWVVPRAWTDMVGGGTAPAVSGTSNNGAVLLDSGWSGPFALRRREALLVTVTDASGGVEQLSLVLYMQELPMNTIQQVPAP